MTCHSFKCVVIQLVSFFAGALGSTFSVQCETPSVHGAGVFQCSLSQGASPNADVIGRFYDEIDTTGWSRLFLRSQTIERTTGFAAGYLEGALTAHRIAQHFSNYKASSLVNLNPKVQTFVEQNDAWTRKQIAANSPHDAYWNKVGFIYDQMDGIMHGANDHLESKHQLSRLDMLLLSLMGDIDDINLAVNETKWMNFENKSLSEISSWAQRHGHCSALVKLVPDGSELFVGHNMWWGYFAMLRVFKHYEFGSLPPIAMSSFPGLVASADDFYQVDSRIVMETTITVYNHELLASVTPEALPYWVRAMTANFIADTGPEWMRIFSKHNSGTYNNMWMVIDYSKFSPGLPLRNGLLTVGEQLPGYFHFEDQTFTLSYGYWPSYNVALYPTCQNLSGQAAMEKKHPELSYQQNARAQVFRRDQAAVQSDADMQRIMRYNKYQTDPLAHGNSCNQLACRSDLPHILKGSSGVGGGGATGSSKRSQLRAFGAIDAKYVSWSHVQAKRTIAISGPTHDDQPVFDWSRADPLVQKTSHLGHPDRFDFDWVVMTGDMEASVPIWWNRAEQGFLQFWATAMMILVPSLVLVVGVAWKLYNECMHVGDEDHYYLYHRGQLVPFNHAAVASPTGANKLASPEPHDKALLGA